LKSWRLRTDPRLGEHVLGDGQSRLASTSVHQLTAPSTSLEFQCILATNTTAGAVTRSRPLCAYPQTAIYNGSGSTDDAANFHCGGNLETPSVVCDSLLVTYKHEIDGALDLAGSGLGPATCRR
jgi:hypothetical protein